MITFAASSRKLAYAQALDQERWEAYLREKSSVEARISLLDRLTEFFGPNGAMMGQAGSQMASFTEVLNRHLAAFGYTCNLSFEPLEIRVISSKDQRFDVPVKHLSQSSFDLGWHCRFLWRWLPACNSLR